MSDDKGWNGPLERQVGKSKEQKRADFTAMAERAGPLPISAMAAGPDHAKHSIPGRELDAEADEREIEEVIVGGGGNTGSEPYIMRYNGIETLAVLRDDGTVCIPSACHIPSAALTELLRRGGRV